MKKPRNEQGQFEKQAGEPIAETPICVRLPISYDARLREMPNRSEWMRRVIMAALDKESGKIVLRN